MAQTTVSASSSRTSCPLTSSSISPVVVSLSGSLIPTNTISMSSATTGNLTTSTPSSLPSTLSQSSTCPTMKTGSYGAGQTTSSNVCPATTILSMPTTNLTSASSYTFTPCLTTTISVNTSPVSTKGQNSSSILCNTSVSSFSSTNPSVHVSSAGNIIPTTTISTASTLVPCMTVPSTSSTCTMSSKYDTKDEHVEYARSCRAIVDLGGDILRYLLNRHILPVDLPRKVHGKTKLLGLLNTTQLTLINNTPVVGYRDLDISLLFSLLRNLCPVAAPTKGWKSNVMPTSTEVNLGDDIQRIRILRNENYGHVSDTLEAGRRSMIVWNELNDVCQRIDTAYGTDFVAHLNRIRNITMDSKTKKQDDAKIKSLKRRCESLEDEVQTEKQKSQKVSRKKKKKKQKLLKMELIRRGEKVLKDHSKKCIVKRKRLEGACLRTLDRDNLLFITGKAGSGKSTVCVEILHQLTQKDDADVYVLKEADEWREVNMSDGTKVLILIEDFCNNVISKNNGIENWRELINEIDFYTKNKSAYVIINIDFDILNTIRQDISIILNRRPPLNVSGKWSLTYSEKKICFNNMLSALESIQTDISDEEIKEICTSEPIIGFFKACHAFFEYPENYSLRAEYFKSLERDYSETIEIMKSNNFPVFAVLVCLLITETSNGCSADMKTLDEICLAFDKGRQTPVMVNESIHNLLRIEFIKMCDKCDTFKFSNTQVHVSVLQSIAKTKTHILMDFGTPTFIFERLRSSRYKPRPGEVCLCLGLEDDDALATKLLSFFDLDRVKKDEEDMCLGHQTCCEKYFLSMLFSKMKDKFKNEKSLCHFYDILEWSCFNAYEHITEETIGILAELDMIKPYIIERAMKMLALSRKPCQRVVSMLIKNQHFKMISSECCFDLIKRSDTLRLESKTRSSIITMINISGEKLTKFILDSIDDTSLGMTTKRVIIKLSAQLSSGDLLKVICSCVDNELHNNKPVLSVLLDLASSLGTTTERNKVFEKMLKKIIDSHVQASTYVDVVRDWMECQVEVDRTVKRELIFIKPMRKSWYEEYVNDEFIRENLKKLKKTDLTVIFHHLFLQNVGDGCLKIFLQTSKRRFDGSDVTKLLIDLLEVDSHFSQNLNILIKSPLLKSTLGKEVTELINSCAQNIIHRSSGKLQKIIICFILASSSNLSLSKFCSLLSQLISDHEEDLLFTLFEFLLEIHGRTALTKVYLNNLSHCILEVHSQIKGAFMKYVGNNRRLQKISPTIGQHIARLAIESKNVPSLLSEIYLVNDKQFRSTIVFTLLELFNDESERNIPMIHCTLRFLSLGLFEISCSALIMAISTAIDTGNPTFTGFQFISSLLQCNRLKADVLQCILMRIVESKTICEMTYDDGKLLLAKTIKTKKPFITRQSILKILLHASMSKLKDNRLLKLFIRNSDIQNLGEMKLLFILRKAVKYKSYSIVRALFQERTFISVCEYSSAKPSCREKDILCTCFLMLFLKSHCSRLEGLQKVWGQFLKLPCYKTDWKVLLKETIKTYSVCGQFELILIVKIMPEYMDFISMNLIENIEAKSLKNIKVGKELSIQAFKNGLFHKYEDIVRFLRSDLFTIDLDILFAFFERLRMHIFYSLDSQFILEALSTTKLHGSLSPSEAFYLTTEFLKLGTDFELSENILGFFRESVFPLVESEDIAYILTKYLKCSIDVDVAKEFIHYVWTTFAEEHLEQKYISEKSAEDECCSLRNELISSQSEELCIEFRGRNSTSEMSLTERQETNFKRIIQLLKTVVWCDSKLLSAAFKYLFEYADFSREKHLKTLLTVRCNDVTPGDANDILIFLIHCDEGESESEVLDTMHDFLISTIFPSFNVKKLSEIFKRCLEDPSYNNVCEALAKYLQEDRDHDCYHVLFEFLRNTLKNATNANPIAQEKLKRFLLFIKLHDHLSTYTEEALIHHLCLILPKENDVTLDLNDGDLLLYPALTILNILLVFKMKREKCLHPVLVFETRIKLEEMSSGNTTLYIKNSTVKIVKDDQTISLDIKFATGAVTATLFDNKHLSADHLAFSLFSLYACFDMKPMEEGRTDIFCLAYVFGFGYKEDQISFPIGGCLINMSARDLILLYLIQPVLSERKDVLNYFRSRIRFSEWNKRNDEDKPFLDSAVSIDDMLVHLGKCDTSTVQSFILNIDEDLTGPSRTLKTHYLCLSILNIVCGREQIFWCLICAIEQVKESYNFNFIETVFSRNILRCLSGLETGICLNALIQGKKCYFHNVKVCLTHSSAMHGSPEERRDFLTYFINTWRDTNYSEWYSVDVLKTLLANQTVKEVIKNEISSKHQLLPSDCMLQYLKACVFNRDWGCFELFIKHKNVTSAVLNNTVRCLVESMSCKENLEQEFSEVLKVIVISSKKMELHTEDLLDVVLELEDSDLRTKFQHIESLVSTQALQHQNDSYILKLIVEILPLNDYCNEGKKVIYIDICRPTILIFLSYLLLKLMPRDGIVIVPWYETSECAEYEIRSLQTDKVFMHISSYINTSGKGQYKLSSALQYCHSESDVQNLLSHLLSTCYDFTGLLYFLLDSLPFELSPHYWTEILTSVIRQSIDIVCDTEMLNEIDQVEPNIRGLELILKTKHGQSGLDQEHLESSLRATIRSYADSSGMMTILLDYFSTFKVQIQDLTFINLSYVVITTPYIRSADYIEKFIAAAKIQELSEENAITLVHACLTSCCDQSRTIRVILSCCPDKSTKKRILNAELLMCLQSKALKNSSNLTIFFHYHQLLHDETILASLIHSASTHVFAKPFAKKKIISFDECKGENMTFVKLLNLYFLRYHHNHVYRMKNLRLPIAQDFIEHVSLSYGGCEFLAVEFIYSSLPRIIDVDTTDVIINTITRKVNTLSWSSNIVTMSLKAIETEESVNPIVLILYEVTETVQLSDEEQQLLLCAMINRKYTGRDDYVRSLLSSPMYLGISEKSVTQILRTAMVKQRNNVTIIDLFLSEAERCGIFLSEPSMQLLISDLCECRHKRTVLYLRKLLQSATTPFGLSDNVFVAALTSYLRVKNESSEVLSFLKENKTELSQNFRCMLEKLKSDIQQNAVRDEDDDIDDDDDDDDDEDDDFSEKRKDEMKRKSKIIDDIIDFYFQMD